MARVYRDRDGKRTALRGKTVGIIGYGIQGRAHALCLRDSGETVVAAELAGTRAWKQAEADGMPVMAAAEESASTLVADRGDALCGMLSALLAIKKRNLTSNIFLPQDPVVDAEAGAEAIARFVRIMKVVKGIRNATIGLFGPRPRDFETCNYNLASIASLGVEVEELGFFDLQNAVEKVMPCGRKAALR